MRYLEYVFKRHLKYYTSKFIFYKWKIWEIQSMKKWKHTYNLMIRDLVSMGKPHHTQLEASSHASQGARSPEHHSLLLSFHQPHSHLVPERITGSCMTMTNFLKPVLCAGILAISACFSCHNHRNQRTWSQQSKKYQNRNILTGIRGPKWPGITSWK